MLLFQFDFYKVVIKRIRKKEAPESGASCFFGFVFYRSSRK